MPLERQELRLGKVASFFVKTQLKHLRQGDETWEADFRALPKPMAQTAPIISAWCWFSLMANYVL